jgi:hypothetical protein
MGTDWGCGVSVAWHGRLQFMLCTIGQAISHWKYLAQVNTTNHTKTQYCLSLSIRTKKRIISASAAYVGACSNIIKNTLM